MSHGNALTRQYPESTVFDRRAKFALGIIVLLFLAGCDVTPTDDPAYLALKANPPTEIPARHLPRLRTYRPSCDKFNEGRSNEYMTCWIPISEHAQLNYYGQFGLGVLKVEPTMYVESGSGVGGFLPIR